MGALLPFLGKAAATTATTAVPASMAGTYFTGASGVTAGLANALNAGITAGSALGGGGALAGALPALATTAPGLGILAKAAPALGGLPAGTTIPTAFNAAQPFANAASGLSKVASAGANPASWSAANQFAGLGASQGANLAPTMSKVSQTVSSKLATPAPQQTPGLVENIRNYKTMTEGAANMSYPPGKQGLSANAAALQQTAASGIDPSKNFLQNAISFAKNPSLEGAGDYIEKHPIPVAAAAYLALKPKEKKPPAEDLGSIRPYEFRRTELPDTREPGSTSQRQYFRSEFIPLEPYSATSPRAKEIEKIAGGGIASAYAVGGPIEDMSAMNAVGGNLMYPQANLQTPLYSNPVVQRPEAVNIVSPGEGPAVGAYSGEQKFAGGGLSDLGGYSDGGRLLRGPGDGVSDSIPAVIGKRQPARLADGEFVIPARIVSELGNGSTEAGARKLYAMMERVQNTRKKSIGKKKVAVNSKADKHLPA